MNTENYFEPPGGLENKLPEIKGGAKEIKETEHPDKEDEEPREFASRGEVVAALHEAFNTDPHLFVKLKKHALKWYAIEDAGKKVTEKDAADLVTLVVRKLLIQKRKWYKANTPNIVNVMLMVIVSVIRNERKKKKPIIKKTSFYDKNGDLVEVKIEEIVRAYLREDISDGTISDQVEDYIKRLEQIFETRDDTIAYSVLDELLNLDRTENKKPDEYIASKLGISSAEVKNAIRRIKRNINQLINTKNTYS